MKKLNAMLPNIGVFISMYFKFYSDDIIDITCTLGSGSFKLSFGCGNAGVADDSNGCSDQNVPSLGMSTVCLCDSILCNAIDLNEGGREGRSKSNYSNSMLKSLT